MVIGRKGKERSMANESRTNELLANLKEHLEFVEEASREQLERYVYDLTHLTKRTIRGMNIKELRTRYVLEAVRRNARGCSE